MWNWLKSWFVKSDRFEICIYIQDGINPETGLVEPLVFIKTNIPKTINDTIATKSLTDLLFAVETGYFHSGFIRSINECRNKLGDAVNNSIIDLTTNLTNKSDNINHEDNIVIYPTEVFNRK